MKLKKYLILVLAISMLLTAVCMFTATAEEETTAPEIDLKIYAKNLALENSIYVSYAVPVEGTEGADSVKMLFWLTPQSEYTYGTQTYELSSEAATSTIGGKQYYVFEFDKLAAKQMTVDIYARVYATDGENEYYSKLDKYSILQYAYNKLGKTSSSVPTATLKNLLNGMLEYGAYAQEHFGTNLDRLATASYYQIKVNGATLSDGADHGLYPVGTLVNTNAPEKNAAGEDFLYWQNSAGEQVSDLRTYTITVGNANETYIAVYGIKDIAPVEPLIYTKLADGTYSVKANPDVELPASVIIPSTYEGAAVTMISPRAFFGCSSLTSIVIPDSVTGIGDSAFYGCAALSSAPLPNTLTSIGDRAFEGCVKLANIVIPNGVTSIGEYAFLDCHSFTEITVPSSVTSLSHAVFYYCVGLTKVTLPNTITSIESFAFANCYELTDITIPSSVVSIGDSAFLSCTSLTNVVIPNSVTFLDGDAFYGCTGLTRVTLPDSLTYLNGGMFENCSNLTSVVIPTSIKIIYGNSFEGTALEAVYYCGTASEWDAMTIYSWNPVVLNAPRYYYSETQPTTEGTYWHYVDGVPTVWEIKLYSLGLEYTSNGDGTCYVSGIGSCTDTHVIIPALSPDGLTVTAMKTTAFYNVDTITSVTIPSTITTLYGSSFYSCNGITAFVVDENNPAYCAIDGNLYTKDGKTLVRYAIGKTDAAFTIPNHVTSIGQSAFADCKNITSITIPDSVTSIGSSAFDQCKALTSVYCSSIETWCGIQINGATATPLEYGAQLYFNNIPVTDVVIPESVTSIGKYAFYNCMSLTSVTFHNAITSIGNNAFGFCRGLTSVEIPNSVTSINDYAFYACSNLKSIQLPNSITSIPTSVFYGCSSLQEIMLPESVTSIGWGAFYDCRSLTNINIPNGVTSINGNAFYNCVSLASIVIPNSVTYMGGDVFYGCASLTSVTIPNSLTQLNGSQFENCTNLTSVVIPTSIKTIYGSSFEGTALEKVYYCGTESDWANMTVYSWNPVILNAPRYYYSETQPTTEGNYWHYVDGVPTVWEFHVHTAVIDAAVAPTCSQSGLTEGSHCSDCGEVLIAQETIMATGNHTFGEWTTVKMPTTTEEGLMERSCVCGEKETQAIEKIISELAYTLNLDGNSYTVSGFGTCTDTDIIIPSTYKGKPVIAIATDAFYDNTGRRLTSVTVPSSVKVIQDRAFVSCYGLTKVTLSEGVETIGVQAFWECPITVINLPSTLTQIKSNAFMECTRIEEVHITDIGSFCSINFGNEMANPLGSGATLCCNGVEIRSLTVPEGTTRIGTYAFSDYGLLTDVTLPDGMTSIGAYAFCCATALTRINIPSSVTSISNCAFANNPKLTIYCAASAQPNSWSSDWNYEYASGPSAPVMWNFDGITRTYSFETNGGDTIAPIQSEYAIPLPTPTKSGYCFVGWYTNSSCSGDPITCQYYGDSNKKLYAKWMTESEFQLYCDASSLHRAKPISNGTEILMYGTETLYFRFVVDVTGYYRIKSNGDVDTYGTLYDSSYTILGSNDDSGSGDNFSMYNKLTAGETYYLAVRKYDSGSAFVTLTFS